MVESYKRAVETAVRTSMTRTRRCHVRFDTTSRHILEGRGEPGVQMRGERKIVNGGRGMEWEAGGRGWDGRWMGEVLGEGAKIEW